MPEKHDILEDKNFDDLVHHFGRNIYGRLKGQIRLAVLERDLEPYLESPLSIIDAGGGQGQLAISLAKRGHTITLCDISREMLKLAEQAAQAQAVDSIKFLNCALQELPNQIDKPVDLILCHAVLEWMAEPQSALQYFHHCLKPGGILSLAFFNINSIIYKNLLRGNYYKVASDDFVGMAGSLTPINPLKMETVFEWCKAHHFEILQHSGIRVFNDYIADPATRNRHPDAVIEMELKFSQQEPFRSLGRYIHVILQKVA